MTDKLDEQDKQQLLEIARHSIQSGLDDNHALQVDRDDISKKLSEKRASFVTLTQNTELRGCMGTLEANEALAQSVANTSYNAAFCDPRFAKLERHEANQTLIEISVLTPMQPLSVIDRQDLFKQLRPGIDGLLLQDGRHRATFLPKVWESLEQPQEFFQHLLRKAGLSGTHWSDNMRLHRYQSESFHD